MVLYGDPEFHTNIMFLLALWETTVLLSLTVFYGVFQLVVKRVTPILILIHVVLSQIGILVTFITPVTILEIVQIFTRFC